MKKLKKTLTANLLHLQLSENYDGPNGSLFISILLHNSEFRILNSELRIPKFALRISKFGIRNCEVYVVWASGNS